MKFAVQLSENLVPEWRDQYLNYKLGKKKLKKLSKANSPELVAQRRTPRVLARGSTDTLSTSLPLEHPGQPIQTVNGITPGELLKVNRQRPKNSDGDAADSEANEYGTIDRAVSGRSLELPPAALEPPKDTKKRDKQSKNIIVNDRSPLLQPYTSSTTPGNSVKSFVRRINSGFSPRSARQTVVEEVSLEDSRTIAEREFIQWLDSEVDKIDKFYDEKEKEALQNFLILQDQLIRLQEHRKRAKEKATQMSENRLNMAAHTTTEVIAQKIELPSLPEKFVLRRRNRKRKIADEEDPSGDGQREDFTRREDDALVPYAAAKRQLKIALSDYYRSLELLKAYRALNHTGVRKMIKKFDKTTGNTKSLAYVEKVSQRYFYTSDVLDTLLTRTENMYAVSFESGNHKHAAEKLRAKTFPTQHYAAMFTTGIFIGFGVPLFVQALVVGIQHLGDPTRPDVSYLFQIWGGYFIVNLMLILFTLNLFAWTHYKINYPFIFEFDLQHHLDYRQYGEIPAFLFFLMSLFGWLTFEDFFPDTCPARFFPIIYLGVVVAIFIAPIPSLHWRARKWFFIAVCRVLLSGLYPVEFRDFFMGDIFCSLNYSISNASFIFCLYATSWKNVYPGSPVASRCSSSESRLLGFLNCLPGIWRFLQCLRRYGDTGEWFPHLANAAKYACLIMYYMFLSLLRISKGKSTSLRVVFIISAAINAVYSSIWDVFMDWSLGQANSKNRFLRDEISFPKWTYYTMIVVDPILRFSWVLYAAYASQIQQSAKISFFVAFIEIVRRFLWVFFRVENEHCTNVVRFRASRDLELPYMAANKKPVHQDSENHHPRECQADRDDAEQSGGTTSASISSSEMRDHATPMHLATGTRRTRRDSVDEALESVYATPPETTSSSEPQPARRYSFASIASPIARAIMLAHSVDFERRKVEDVVQRDETYGDDDDEDEEDLDDDEEER